MKVKALYCLECGYLIFSRARHDYRECHCGNISVDGGSDYLKSSFKDNSKFIVVEFEIKQTKKELSNDYNRLQDRFGMILYNDLSPEIQKEIQQKIKETKKIKGE